MVWPLLKTALILMLIYLASRYLICIGARRAVENIIRGFNGCSGDRTKLNEALKLHSPWYLFDGPSLLTDRGFKAEISTQRVGEALYGLAFEEAKTIYEKEDEPPSSPMTYDFEFKIALNCWMLIPVSQAAKEFALQNAEVVPLQGNRSSGDFEVGGPSNDACRWLEGEGWSIAYWTLSPEELDRSSKCSLKWGDRCNAYRGQDTWGS